MLLSADLHSPVPGTGGTTPNQTHLEAVAASEQQQMGQLWGASEPSRGGCFKCLPRHRRWTTSTHHWHVQHTHQDSSVCCVCLSACLQQSESVVKEACAEFEVACSEVNLQQQLEELEALVLQRGLLGDANRCAEAAPTRTSQSHTQPCLSMFDMTPQHATDAGVFMLFATHRSTDPATWSLCSPAVLMCRQPCRRQWRQQHAWLPSAQRSSS